MNILWMSWKDRGHPKAGGAEYVSGELMRRLAEDGHQVTLLTAAYPNAPAEETVKGVHIIRKGGRYTVYWHAYQYYKNHKKDWPDLVIDEMNTMPFFAKFYVKGPVLLFVHQLCRQIWFHEMVFPLSLAGYLAEPLYLRILSSMKTITVSQSTKVDLERYGFRSSAIQVIQLGSPLHPASSLESLSKYDAPTLLSLGSIRSMKRTKDIVKAFELAKEKIPSLRLMIAGSADGRYGHAVVNTLNRSEYSSDIYYLGKVTAQKKQELLQRSHLLLVSSVKEGWGLVVTEANSQGTPAIVYDVDGLRDSVQHEKTGIVTRPHPQAMAEAAVSLLKNDTQYHRLQSAAWQWSQQLDFDSTYQQFLSALPHDRT